MKTENEKIEAVKKSACVILEYLSIWDEISSKKVQILQKEIDSIQTNIDDITSALYREAWEEY